MSRVAWLGGAMAACLVGAPLVLAEDAAPPEGTRPGEPEVPATAPDELRPDLLLDQAERLHARAEEADREERAAHEAALARWRESQGGVAAARPPVCATPRADALRAAAIRLAQRALDAAPAFPGAARALLVAGVDAAKIGRAREARRALGTLVRRHPDSPPAGEGWLVVAEHHLAAGDLTRARAALEAAQRSSLPAVRSRAEARLVAITSAVRDQAARLR